MDKSISEITVGKRHRVDLGDVAGLAASIKEHGLLHPIVIRPDGLLIAGERRLEACKSIGMTQIPVTVVDLADVVLGELAENSVRKDFLPSETVAIKRAVASLIATPEGRPKGKPEPIPLLAGEETKESFLSSEKGQTRDKAARYVGVSGRTLEKAEAIVKAAEAEPERFSKLLDDMDRTGRIDGPYKRLKIARQAQAIRAEPPPLPSRGPYRVIVADPPWPYDVGEEDPSHRATRRFSTMSIAEICAVAVRDIAHEDCILWLWTTNYHMREAFTVLDAWGFQQRSILTWVKPRMGRGDWLRGQTEHALMAVRGKPTVQLTNQTTVLYGPVRAECQKPEEFFEFVEALCPAARYAELFAGRHTRPNWDVHGYNHAAEDAPSEERAELVAGAGDEARIQRASAVAIWEASLDPRGTPAETYLRGRGFELDDGLAGDVLRWNPNIGALVVLFRNITTAEPQAVTCTLLDREGRQRERKIIGDVADAAIMLDPPDAVTSGLHIASRLGTAMAARRTGGIRPTWVVSDVASFPVLAVESLTIILGEKDDDAGAQICADRWRGAGRVIGFYGQATQKQSRAAA